MKFGLILFFALFSIVYICPGNTKKNHTSLLFPLIFLLFFFFLIIYSSQTFEAAKYGFNLWLNIVFPSLLPFFITAELIKGTGIIKASGRFLEPIMRPIFNIPGAGSFAFIMGLFSGYPVGAKVSTDLYESGLCSKNETERLLAFSNNSSPLFITAAVAVGIFGKPEIGLLLLSAHILGCITVGIIFGIYSRKGKGTTLMPLKHKNRPLAFSSSQQSNISFSNIGLKLGEAIMNSINTLLMICGFIVLFNVIITILLKIGIIGLLSSLLKTFFFPIDFAYCLTKPLSAGLFEITTGTNLVKLCFAPLSQKLIIASFIIGWGGLSVHAQVASIAAKSGISIKPYLLGKFLQGLFSAIYTAVLLKINGVIPNNELPVFNTIGSPMDVSWNQYFVSSSEIAGLILISAIIIPLLIRFLYQKGGLQKHI